MRIGKKKESAAAVTNDVPTKPLCVKCGIGPISILNGDSLCVLCFVASIQAIDQCSLCGTFPVSLRGAACASCLQQSATANNYGPATIALQRPAAQNLAAEPAPTFEVTDSTELVRGYKAFSLEWMTLKGGYNQFWHERSMTAECSPGSSLRALLAGDSNSSEWNAVAHLETGECECGIWSTKTLAELRSRWMGSDISRDYRNIVAEVILSGVVIGAERGYRSEHAEIQQLWLPKPPNDEMMAGYSATANALASRYGVPVTIGYPEEAEEIVSDESGSISLAQFQQWNSYYGGTGVITRTSSTTVTSITSTARQPSSAWIPSRDHLSQTTVYRYVGKYRNACVSIADVVMNDNFARKAAFDLLIEEEDAADNP